MYFEPTLERAFKAGQELAQIIVSGELAASRVEATDKALFIAGTANAYFAANNTTMTVADFGQNTNEELARHILNNEDVTTSSFDLTMLLELAERIICSL